jgi:hypothetical protein
MVEMTLIKETMDYTIESERSERMERSDVPGALLAFSAISLGISYIFYALVKNPELFKITISMGAVLFFLGILLLLTTKEKIIPTLKITLEEKQHCRYDEDETCPYVRLIGRFGTWREIDVTKDIDELTRRIQNATDSVVKAREDYIAEEKTRAQKKSEKEFCIADLEDQAIRGLK